MKDTQQIVAEAAELLRRARRNVEHSASHAHGAASRELLKEIDAFLSKPTHASEPEYALTHAEFDKRKEHARAAHASERMVAGMNAIKGIEPDMNDLSQIVAEVREKIARDFKLMLTPRGETDMDAHILSAIEKADTDGYWRGRGDAEKYRAAPASEEPHG